MIVRGSAPTRYQPEPTIGAQLERISAERPDAESLIDGGRRRTWSDVRRDARAIARALVAAGVGRGDHVAVWLPNQAEWPLTWMAATYIGAVVVPVNTRYRVEEVRYILLQSDARLLVARDRFLGIDYRAMLHELGVGRDGRAHGGDALPELRETVVIGDDAGPATTWDAFLARGTEVEETEIDDRLDAVEPDDPTIIVYTSGTSGHPKGVVHSHRVLRNEVSISEYLRIEPDSRILGHMPFFHVAGGLSAILPPVITGAALVLMERWDPTRAMELIERERITVFGGIATHFIDLLDHPELARFDLASLRTGWVGGSTNPRAVIEGALTRLGIEGLLPVYGMTETTSVTTYPSPGDSFERICSGTGRPISDFELKLIDGDGAELDVGEEGEICVRGHVVMQGYYRNPEATAQAIDAEGWFHTGDLGRLDDEGYLAITGRRTDMFIVGGANVYPAEIELALSEHPGISQAHVVGVPHPRLGEVGFAFVEARAGTDLTEADVRAHCEGRLAEYKIPRHVQLVSDWPMTATGKVQRFRLRELAGEAVAGAEPAAGAN
jgi:fatty-acyl-CoA synthase